SLDHAGGVIHHDHAAGARHGACGHQRVEVHLDVDLFRREHFRGDSTRDHSLEPVTATHALSVAVDQFPERHAHWRLIETGPVHVPAHREQPRAALFWRSQTGETLWT